MLLFYVVVVSQYASAQGAWNLNGSNQVITTTIHNVGINTTAPNSQLQIHGTQSFIGWDKFGSSINHGITARQRFTTTTSGTGVNSGFELRYSGTTMNMVNLSIGGNIEIAARNTPSMFFNSSAQRIFFGTGAPQGSESWEKRASINIDHSSENGLYIRAANANRYGLFIHSQPNQAAFVIESGTGFTTTRNFSITGDGYVFARRYTTTLGPIGDYVFAPNYYLMPLSELRIFIRENSHLPNVIPTSVAETEETDLVEFAKTLLVKIEENLLYILQLEERIQQLEAER
jgi:hypothetical protein